MKRLWFSVVTVAAVMTLGLSGALATTGATPGVSSTTIDIGATFPLSGPVSFYAPIAKGMKAYFSYVNSRKATDGRRGVNGRQIHFNVLDDQYIPANAVQATRQLVEQDHVFAMVGGLGTANQVAVRDYLNQMKVPQVFVSTGATTFGADYKKYPWTIGWQPTYHAEGSAYAKYLNAHDSGAKVGVLYQNDDYGHDYLNSFKEALKNKNQIVDEEGFEVTSPSPQSQVVKLKASGADTFLVLVTPTATIQSLVIAYKLGWKPKLYVNSVSATDTFLTAAQRSAGSPDAVNGIITDTERRPSHRHPLSLRDGEGAHVRHRALPGREEPDARLADEGRPAPERGESVPAQGRQGADVADGSVPDLQRPARAVQQRLVHGEERAAQGLLAPSGRVRGTVPRTRPVPPLPFST